MAAYPVNTCRACLHRIAKAQTPRIPFASRSLSTSTSGPSTSYPSTPRVRTPATVKVISTRTDPAAHPSSFRRFVSTRLPVFQSTYLPRRLASTASATSRSALPDSLSDFINAKGSTERPPIHVTAPSLDAIKEEGYLDDDVKLIAPEDATLLITPEAIAQLERITSKEPKEVLEKGQLALRVGVESGGCHGYQYTMEIVEERGVDDYVMQPEGVNCIPVIVDLVSLGLLKGATLHHATELIGSSFRLQDNPQAKEGGNCGCGVSWELK